MEETTKKVLKEFFKLKLIELGILVGIILFFALLFWMSSQHNFLSTIAIIIFILLIIVVFGSAIIYFFIENWEEAKKNIEKKGILKTGGQTKK